MQVKVENYKGENELEKGLVKMLTAGWDVQNQSTRKQACSLATGVFTKKQIHTVTFARP